MRSELKSAGSLALLVGFVACWGMLACGGTESDSDSGDVAGGLPSGMGSSDIGSGGSDGAATAGSGGASAGAGTQGGMTTSAGNGVDSVTDDDADLPGAADDGAAPEASDDSATDVGMIGDEAAGGDTAADGIVGGADDGAAMDDSSTVDDSTSSDDSPTSDDAADDGMATDDSAATDDGASDDNNTDDGPGLGTGVPDAVDGTAFTVEQRLASQVDATAPTTVGIITWSTTLPAVVGAYIEFGLDDSYGMVAPVDLTQADNRTLLLGMKPDREYHYRIVVDDGTTRTASDDLVIQTGAATDLVSIGEFNVVDEASREPGFIVTSYWQGNGASVGFILDADGEIVWWHDFGANGIARMRMSASGKNMWMIVASNNGAGLQRVGLDGLGGESYSATTGSHDLTPVEGELMAFLEYGETDCDSIFTIDPSGATEEIWESNELFGGGGGMGGGGMGVGAGCHSNALRYSQAEDIFTFSDVSQDIVGISRTGELVWRLSEIVPNGIAAWGSRNHGHHLLSDSLLIYANEGGQDGASAAVEYDMSSGAEIFRYDSGDGSANLGDVQRLPGGNTLVTHSNDSLVHEVARDGSVVMAFDGAGARIGYSLWRSSLYGAPPDLVD